LAAPLERHELWFEKVALHDTHVHALVATEAHFSDTIITKAAPPHVNISVLTNFDHGHLEIT
jgi:hypothetical protein